VAALERAVTLSPGGTLFLAQLGQAYAVAGKVKEAREVLEKLHELSRQRYVSPYHFAYVYTGLAEEEEAIDWLEKAYEQRAGAVGWDQGVVPVREPSDPSSIRGATAEDEPGLSRLGPDDTIQPANAEGATNMRVLVTGARGKVGTATTAALIAAGHEVTCTDVMRGVFERPLPGEPAYIQADLTHPGDAFAVVRGMNAVIHAAAIPDPTHNTPANVFQNNLMSTFNVIEAAVRFGVSRFVNISSETVPGFFFPERPFLPDYVPVDENHKVRPQDPYALSKYFGELLMDAAVQRSDIRCISIRPCWVQHEGNYERNLGPQVRDPSLLSPNLWSYIDVYDLADALVLAAASDLPGHELFYIASPDNVGGRPFVEMVRKYYGEKIQIRPVDRKDAAGISSAKAMKMLGYAPKRSWRDYLDDQGRLKAGIARR
jgi:nucleoside-diphosphate-sugar epimerase